MRNWFSVVITLISAADDRYCAPYFSTLVLNFFCSLEELAEKVKSLILVGPGTVFTSDDIIQKEGELNLKVFKQRDNKATERLIHFVGGWYEAVSMGPSPASVCLWDQAYQELKEAGMAQGFSEAENDFLRRQEELAHYLKKHGLPLSNMEIKVDLLLAEGESQRSLEGEKQIEEIMLKAITEMIKNYKKDIES